MAFTDVTIGNGFVEFGMRIRKSTQDDQHEIKVRVKTDGMTHNDALEWAFGGTNLRVTWANKIRESKTNVQLAEMSKTLQTITWKEMSETIKKGPMDFLMTLDKAQFITWMEMNMGIDEEQAIEIYNRKHGIKG